MNETLAIIIGSLLSGSLITGILQYFSKRKENEINHQDALTNDFEVLQKAWRVEFTRLSERLEDMHREIVEVSNENKQLKQRQAELTNIIDKLKERLSKVSSIHPDLPIPMWIKDTSGMMMSLNESYETAFLIPNGFERDDYIGNRDIDIWGREQAKKFRENDKIVKDANELIMVDEGQNDKDSPFYGWQLFKYPKFSDGVLIGIGGIALPTKQNNLT